MRYDRKITISTGAGRRAVQWNPESLLWSELIARLKAPRRGTETLDTYLNLPRAKQDDLKDVGGFVGGTIRGGRRRAGSVVTRDVLTLDLDSVSPGGTDAVLRAVDALGCAYCVYSTRKHHPAAPRLRVLLCTDRPVTADEYEPILRRVASRIDSTMRMCDPSTFEVTRLMYWPSVSSDSQYVYTFDDRPFLSADGILATYADWHDVGSWPQCPDAQKPIKRLLQKQGDPEKKTGLVGAFCRVFDVERALRELIPDAYEPTRTPERYTYTGGSTTGGAIVYDGGRFLYSHHATDPCGGRLCNAFDLVRLHLFGDEDDAASPDTPTNKLPSYAKMVAYARANREVFVRYSTEHAEAAVTASQAFADKPPEADPSPEEPAYTIEQVCGMLEASPSGLPAKTLNNFLLILNCDPNLRGAIALEAFSNRGIVKQALPWNPDAGIREWTDADDAGVLWYIENTYRLYHKDKSLSAMRVVAEAHRYNCVKDYLESLEWDQKPRIERLFTEYFGAEDNVYTRQVARKSLTAAVARIYEPGVKYDYMPILYGAQGVGKSTFLRTLGGAWFSDSLTDFEGKEAREHIQGVWIVEIGELEAFSRSAVTAIKQFLSQQEDIYREPYGRRTNSYPRRCVFFGTTNEAEFLRDNTGERRFWPVDLGVRKPTKSVFTDLPDEAAQIWAEAVASYKAGTFIGDLEGDAKTIWGASVKLHKVMSPREGLIREFLEKETPEDFDRRTIQERKTWWYDGFSHSETSTVRRARVCAAEIWIECLGQELGRMKNADAKEINTILAGLEGWSAIKCPRKFGPYGNQRGFERATNSATIG